MSLLARVLHPPLAQSSGEDSVMPIKSLQSLWGTVFATSVLYPDALLLPNADAEGDGDASSKFSDAD